MYITRVKFCKKNLVTIVVEIVYLSNFSKRKLSYAQRLLS